jgi:hypothetical protein
MSEWVDFCIYSVQALLLWIAMPRWGSRFTRPMLADRNPEWAAANEYTIAQLEHGGWWKKAMQGWAIVSVLVLMACRIDRLPMPAVTRRHTPSWEVLMTTSNLMMMVGFLLFGYGVWSFLRWLKRNVPMTERRNATLVPRTTDDFVPRWLQYLIYGAMLAGLAARPVADAIWPDRLRNVWGTFGTGLAMSVLLFLVAVGSVVRPPNHIDRALGPRYRRTEVRICFALMAYLTILGMVGLYLELAGFNTRRYGALLVASFVCITLVSCMRLPTTVQTLPPADEDGDADARALKAH